MKQNHGQQKHLQGIAQVLIMEKMLEREKALEYQASAQRDRVSFVQYLIKNKICNAAEISQTGAKSFGVPLFDLEVFDKDLLPEALINEKLVNRHQALPLYKHGELLYVAMEDPSQQTALREFKFQTGLNTQCVIADADKLSNLIREALEAKESAAFGDFLDDGDLDDIDISSDEEEESQESTGGDADDAPIVRFVNKILLDSIHQGASDIHFEPFEKSCRVRFRQDGILHEVATPPLNLASRITARLKVMSSLDISERRIPQDGRFKMRLSKNNAIDFRVSTCPTVGGEKVVMRLLDPSAANLGVEALGFSPEQKALFTKIIHQPQGLVLVTGPTGSGKTVTLYTALNILNTMEKNISTVEDPVEIKVAGINQVNINHKTGLDFASTLRSFLRQDPDIIMVGEMRDLETAEIGIKAAQTGHMVLSTLHTNSAPETLTRLANMGIPLFNIASSVSLIIAQRLARRLCEHCKQAADIPHEALIDAGFKEDQLKDTQMFEPNGCEYCTQGYKGRVGLYEVLDVDKQIADCIMSGATSLDIEAVAKTNGMASIRESGLAKICQGVTSLEEINRVTKD